MSGSGVGMSMELSVRRHLGWAVVLTMLLGIGSAAAAELRFGTPFRNHAVLQCDSDVRVWGTAEPSGEVTVTFGPHVVGGVADAHGRWSVALPPMPPNAEGRQLSATSVGSTVVAVDVVVGEVWLCGGQSNMALPVKATTHRDQDVSRAAAMPTIRFLRMPHLAAPDPVEMVDARWITADGASVLEYSAVAWGFAWHVHNELGVPIGIIQADWEDTKIESWLPESVADADPAFAAAMAVEDAGPRQRLREAREVTQALRHMRSALTRDGERLVDQGRQPFALKWHQVRAPNRMWHPLNIPGSWEKSGLSLDGAVWFSRQLTLPEAWAGKNIIVELGAIDDHDHTYFNGQLIGSTGAQTEASWRVKRRYVIPAEQAVAGDCSLNVRIWDEVGRGGFRSEPEDLRWFPEDDESQALSLAGEWRYRVELALPERNFGDANAQHLATVLYNGMIAPVRKFALRGVCWYQGEANSGDPKRYAELLPLLVEHWRSAFDDQEMHVSVVQLPAFGKDAGRPDEWSWASMREAQSVVLNVPNTSLAITIDTGSANEVHPRDKQAISERLARLALADVYHAAVNAHGPQCVDFRVEGSEAFVTFAHADGLRTVDGEAPREFFICGTDRKWRRAHAEIRGETVALLHEKVRKPIAVRYAWTAAPSVNLVNSDGLPAAPFRTDR